MILFCWGSSQTTRTLFFFLQLTFHFGQHIAQTLATAFCDRNATGTDELQIFPMGTPVDQIPEGFLSWTGMYFDPETEENLPFYGIYNAAEECAFISME